MASRRRKPNPSASSGVSATPATVAGHFLPALEEFGIHGDGQISIGTIKPIACAAIANDGHNMLAALVQLLERLDQAVQLALVDEVFTDEINVPGSPSRR